MMSLLFPGMDKPSSCKRCPMMSQRDEDWGACMRQEETNLTFEAQYVRCPAVWIPDPLPETEEEK